VGQGRWHGVVFTAESWLHSKGLRLDQRRGSNTHFTGVGNQAAFDTGQAGWAAS